MHIFWCLLDPTKTCSFIGLIEVCRILTGFFWDAADSFAGLFDGFYYIFTRESTSKADKFDNLRSMKILNTSLTQICPWIRTKRPEQEQTLQTKKDAISRPWRMSMVIVRGLPFPGEFQKNSSGRIDKRMRRTGRQRKRSRAREEKQASEKRKSDTTRPLLTTESMVKSLVTNWNWTTMSRSIWICTAKYRGI